VWGYTPLVPALGRLRKEVESLRPTWQQNFIVSIRFFVFVFWPHIYFNHSAGPFSFFVMGCFKIESVCLRLASNCDPPDLSVLSS
jgi:hypothetical protein